MRLSLSKCVFVSGLASAVILGAPNAIATPVQIFSSGNFLDPSTTVSGVRFDTLASPVFAVSFSLNYSATLESVNLWSYDTIDGSGGSLTALQYAIYTGNLQPVGSALASGSGTNVTTSSIPGHRYFCNPCAETGFYTQLHSFDVETPITLNGQTTYWLVLSALVDPTGVSARAEWAPSNGANSSFLSYGSNGWSTPSGSSRAFDLNGTPSPVSEPSSVALVGMGLAALGYVRRKVSFSKGLGSLRQ